MQITIPCNVDYLKIMFWNDQVLLIGNCLMNKIDYCFKLGCICRC